MSSRIPPDAKDVLAIFDQYGVTHSVTTDYHGNPVTLETIADQVCDAVDKYYQHLSFLKDLIIKQDELLSKESD